MEIVHVALEAVFFSKDDVINNWNSFFSDCDQAKTFVSSLIIDLLRKELIIIESS